MLKSRVTGRRIRHVVGDGIANQGNVIDGQYYRDDQLTQVYVADDAGTMYVSALGGVGAGGGGGGGDTPDTPPPLSQINDITLITGNNCVFYDGRLYANNQVWANQIAAPVDSSSQTDSDLYVGSTGSVGSDDPTYTGIKWTVNGSQFFVSKAGANTPIIADMHKKISTNVWTLFAQVTPSDSVPTVNTIFATADSAGSVGINIRVDSTGTLKLDQYDGTTFNTKSATTKLVPGTTADIAVGVDMANDVIYFSVNGDWQIINGSGWTNISTAATYPFRVGVKGAGNGKMISGCAISCLGIFKGIKSSQQLSDIRAWIDQRYASQAPAATPSKVGPVAAMGWDTVGYLSWPRPSTPGGDNISDYLIQYKKHTDVSWTTFSHAAQTTLLATLTTLTDATDYDVQVAAINSSGTGPFSDVVTFTVNSTQTAPYDPSLFKLTVPVTTTGERIGTSYDITPATDAECPWFGRYESGVFHFQAPDGGATTSANAFACRSELRHLTDIPNATTFTDTIKFTLDTANDGDKVVMWQIHGPSSAVCKVVWRHFANGTGYLYAIIQVLNTLPNDGLNHIITTPALVSNITLGQQISMKAAYNGNSLGFFFGANVTGSTPDYLSSMIDPIDGTTTRASQSGTQYLKRGIYPQSTAFTGFLYKARHFTIAGVYTP